MNLCKGLYTGRTKLHLFFRVQAKLKWCQENKAAQKADSNVSTLMTWRKIQAVIGTAQLVINEPRCLWWESISQNSPSDTSDHHSTKRCLIGQKASKPLAMLVEACQFPFLEEEYCLCYIQIEVAVVFRLSEA